MTVSQWPTCSSNVANANNANANDANANAIDNAQGGDNDNETNNSNNNNDSEEIGQRIEAQNQENMMPFHRNNDNRVFSEDESDDESYDYSSSSSSDRLSDSEDEDGDDNGSGGEEDGEHNNNIAAAAADNANANDDGGENDEGQVQGDQPRVRFAEDQRQQQDQNHMRRIRIGRNNAPRDNNRHENNENDNGGRDQRHAAGERRPEPPEFHVRKYNFFLFPSSNSSSREVVLSPASIVQMSGRGRGERNEGNGDQNLQDENLPQNLDFNEWLKNGVPYTTLDQAEGIMREFQADHNKHPNENGANNGSGNAVSITNGSRSNELRPNHHGGQNGNGNGLSVTEWEEPTDPSDIAFIARVMANLREWIDQAAQQGRVFELAGLHDLVKHVAEVSIFIIVI